MSKWDKVIEQICEGVKPTMRDKIMSDYKEILVKEYYNEKGLITRREIGEEIVRCGDCIFWDKRVTFQNYCTKHDLVSYPDDYCAWGEEQEHENRLENR